MHRLEQVYGYRSYAYMKRRWEQYCKRLTRQQRAYANAGWEETLDLILDFLTPVWSAFCNVEIFYDDWMPEPRKQEYYPACQPICRDLVHAGEYFYGRRYFR